MAFNRVLNAVANVMAIASGSTQGTSYAVTTGNPILVDCAWHLWMHLAFSVCVVDFIVMYKKKFLGILFGFMITILRVKIRRKTAMAEINNIQDIRNVR